MKEMTKKRIKVINFLFSTLFTEVLEEEIKPHDLEEYNIYKQVLEKLTEIDEIIKDAITNYDINRLNKVDLSIIRYAVYEMKYLNTPFQIAINEAIILTKLFSDTDDNRQHQFSNKLLDKIKDNLKGEQNGK